jgi:hypothetical protein
VVLVPIALFVFFIKDHMKTLIAYHVLIFVGMGLVGLFAILHAIVKSKGTGMALMIGSGIGLYLAYVPFNNIIWDLILATFEYSANSGFLMYICDSLGYLSSVAVLMGRNFAASSMAWGTFYIGMCCVMAGTGIICMSISFFYYLGKYRRTKGFHTEAVEVAEKSPEDDASEATPEPIKVEEDLQ